MTRDAASDRTWRLRDAKARLSEVIRRAGSEGPQHVTVGGREAAVVVSAAEYRRLTGRLTGADLIAALQACPYPDFEIGGPSVRSPVRDVDL